MKKNFKVRLAFVLCQKFMKNQTILILMGINDKAKYEPNEATHRFSGIIPIGINCFGSP
jgi:hypothetical protein